MRRIERLGVELAYALRMRQQRREAYENADQEVKRLEETILAAEGRELEETTGSQPAVPDDRPTERFAAPVFEQCAGPGICSHWGVHHEHIGGRVWSNA